MSEPSLAEDEMILEKWQNFLLKENFTRITSRLKITQRLISLLYSKEIITKEDKEILENSSLTTAEKQQKLLEMWGNVPEKIQTLIDILNRDEFLLKPVATILEEFGEKISKSNKQESKAPPVQVMTGTSGKAGKSTAGSETGTVIHDAILPVATDITDDLAPDSENTASLQAGGMAGNDFNAARDIVSQTTSNSNNQFGSYNIQQAIFFNQVPPPLLSSLSLAAATSSSPAVQPTPPHTYMEEVSQTEDASKGVKPSSS